MTDRRLRRHRPIPVLLAAAVMCLPAAATAADRVSKLIDRADRSFERRDYQRAVELYARADRAADGESLAAVIGLARSSFALVRYGETIKAAERWIAMADSPEARNAGYTYLGLGLHGRGLTERWGRKAQKGGEESGAPDWRARGTAGEESLRAAADAFRRAAEGPGASDQGRTVVLLNLADTLVWLGEYGEAAEVLDAYDAAGGDDVYAYELRCWAGSRRYPEQDVEAKEPVMRPWIDGDDEAPVKIFAPPPRYPISVRAARIESTVILQGIITKEGALDCLRPLSGYPYPLVRAAMTTVRKWRFKPARMNGEPVDVYYNLAINFTLRD